MVRYRRSKMFLRSNKIGNRYSKLKVPIPNFIHMWNFGPEFQSRHFGYIESEILNLSFETDNLESKFWITTLRTKFSSKFESDHSNPKFEAEILNPDFRPNLKPQF